MAAQVMLNIGCGATHHPDWVNLDVSPVTPSVLPIDISKGLPFPAGSVSVCYSSHLLEHLDKKYAANLLAECMRVLDHQGVIRIVVPDLEGIVREYLRILDGLLKGDKTRVDDYDWIMLELYDQVVRNASGGEMATWLGRENLSNEKFVIERCGMEAKKVIERSGQKREGSDTKQDAWLVKLFRRMRASGFGREVLIRFLLQDEYKTLKIGRFRVAGEVHQWMYDQYSLTRLLSQHGFVDIVKCSAFESRIPDFERYSLDVQNGGIRKPDSLFIEAIKP